MKLFIFGSTGDLVKRKIVPAFIELGMPDIEIIALGRKEFTDEMYHSFICNDDCFRNFKQAPKYHKINFSSDEMRCEKCNDYLSKTDKNYFYSALPPEQTMSLLKYFSALKKEGYAISALIEKPFGSSLENAYELKNFVEDNNLRDSIYISDHYLFKDEILNLKKGQDFKKLSLISLETVGLENRFYYDAVGALRDMIQSHFLNIVFKLLPQPPKDIEGIKILYFERGQYTGDNGGYITDLGKASSTETFVKVKFVLDGRDIKFATGKKFNEKINFIRLDGKKIPLTSAFNPYAKLFSEFFAGNREHFPTMDDSITAWKIVERLEQEIPLLKFYPEGMKGDSLVTVDD